MDSIRRPAVPGTPLDDEEEALCARYARVKFWWAVAEMALLLATLAGLTLTGTAAAIASELQNVTRSVPGHAFLYLATVGLLVRLVVLPVQFASGHVVERLYGLSRQSALGWLGDWALATTVFGGMLLAFLTPLVLSMQYCHYWYWCLLLTPPWLVVFCLLRSFYYRKLFLPVLRLFYPVRYLTAESFFLPGIGRRQMPVYEVEVGNKTRRCNACVILTGGTGSVLVTDTLVDQFSDAEEKVVVAHEFGHLYDRLFLEERTSAGLAQARRKLWYAGGGWLGVAILGLCAVQLLEGPLGLHIDDLAAFPLEVALVLGLGQLLSPFLNAESRIDEREADEYALKITRDVDSYFAVMNKLRRINLEESCPGALDRLFYGTHPSYLERVQIGHSFAKASSRLSPVASTPETKSGG
jgi:Zn-dependent protease with chaperone function